MRLERFIGSGVESLREINERLVAAGCVVKILEGLHYIHQSNVVQCDLKAANILTTKAGNVELSDFFVSLDLGAVKRDEGCRRNSELDGR